MLKRFLKSRLHAFEKRGDMTPDISVHMARPADAPAGMLRAILAGDEAALGEAAALAITARRMYPTPRCALGYGQTYSRLLVEGTPAQIRPERGQAA